MTETNIVLYFPNLFYRISQTYASSIFKGRFRIYGMGAEVFRGTQFSPIHRGASFFMHLQGGLVFCYPPEGAQFFFATCFPKQCLKHIFSLFQGVVRHLSVYIKLYSNTSFGRTSGLQHPLINNTFFNDRLVFSL